MNRVALLLARQMARAINAQMMFLYRIGIQDTIANFSAVEAFRTVFGGNVTLKLSGQEQGHAAEVDGNNDILVHKPGYLSRHPRLLGHELGHVFNNVFGKTPENFVPDDLLRMNGDYEGDEGDFNGFAGGQDD